MAINLGTGRGTTVGELLDAFNRVAGAYTRIDRARSLLGWQPQYDITAGIRHSLQWAAIRGQILPDAASPDHRIGSPDR